MFAYYIQHEILKYTNILKDEYTTQDKQLSLIEKDIYYMQEELSEIKKKNYNLFLSIYDLLKISADKK